MNIQLERLHKLMMYGTKAWFICSKHPDMVRGAAQMISGAAYSRLSPQEQQLLRSKSVIFTSGQCITSDPMVAYACMNANPELGIATVQKWKKEMPGGALYTYVSPPTNDPTPEPIDAEMEMADDPVVADPIQPEREPQPEPQVVRAKVGGRSASTTKRRAPRKTR